MSTVPETVELGKITEGHVFYRFEDEETYFNHIMSFITSGLASNMHILIIENMKHLPKLRRMINELSNEQQSAIRLVNNFDYYIAGGDFNTQTILSVFQKDLSELKKSNSSIRTWANVEWASDKPDAQLLKDFESQADDFVLEQRMISVCAYSSASLSSRLNTVLEQSHKYVMTDDTFEVSSLYVKSNTE
jgi:hypothetical protein